MLEAGSGIVSQHDYDPESSCEGWNGCRCEQRARATRDASLAPSQLLVARQAGAWWNVSATRSTIESPLWAFTSTAPSTASRFAPSSTSAATGTSDKIGLELMSTDSPPVRWPSVAVGRRLAYLKHDSMGPTGAACIMIFNPGAAQTSTST